MKLIFSIAFLAMIYTACNVHSAGVNLQTNEALLMDTLPGSCPFFAKGNKGNVILSWVRSLSDTSAVVCYAVSTDDGKTFGSVNTIPSSSNVHPHAENMPKMIIKPSGEMIAVWGAGNPNPKNKYSGLVYYAQSFDGGKNWSAAKPLVNDTAGFDQRYFDVALLQNGEAVISWLDNRKSDNSEGSALYFAQTACNKGFLKEIRIDQSCCQCCRTKLFVDANNGVHVLYRSIINDTIRDMVHTVSVDGGKTFSKAQRINEDNWVIKACPHTGPTMTENKNGLHFAWYTGAKDQGVLYTQSANNGKSFTGADSVRTSARHPQMTTINNGALVVVWDEMVKENNVSVSRIGVQLRAADGKRIGESFITTDTLNATYPVLTAINNNRLAVACCIKKNGKSYVAYKQVTFQ